MKICHRRDSYFSDCDEEGRNMMAEDFIQSTTKQQVDGRSLARNDKAGERRDWPLGTYFIRGLSNVLQDALRHRSKWSLICIRDTNLW